MKIVKTILGVLILLIVFGCKNTDNKNSELELKEKELELRERELNLKEENLRKLNQIDENTNEANISTHDNQYQPNNTNIESNSIKYVYMVFSVSEPKLIKETFMPSGNDIFGNPRTGIETFYRVEYEKYTYTTEIQELKNYNEDIKFKYIDKMEENVLNRANLSFNTDVFRLSDEDKESIRDNGAKIINKKMNEFNTYKEASIHRNKSNSKI